MRHLISQRDRRHVEQIARRKTRGRPGSPEPEDPSSAKAMSSFLDLGHEKCSAAIGEGAYFMASIMAVTGIMATVLVLSGVFHAALRRLGQPSIISHILAGIVVGPTVLGRAVDLHELGMQDAGRALSGTIFFVRMVFMFFIGLELDLRYLRRNLRRSLAVACGGSALCFVLAVLAGPFFYGLLHPGQASFQPNKIYASTALFALVLTSTASPVLIRIVTELKLTGSETGQLAIGAAFANDMASLTALSVIVVTHTVYGGPPVPKKAELSPVAKAARVAVMVATVWVAVSLAAWAARLLNRLKRGRQYISKYELCGMLILVMFLSLLEQVVGNSVTMTAFLIGLAMPREGPTARTFMDRLAYPVHQLIMPLCFGAIGARLDFAKIEHFTAVQLVVAVAFTTLLSAAGKVAGTVLACRALGIATREAVVLGALLNVKGYSDILAINFGNKVHVWSEPVQVVLLLSSIINTFMAGPASAAIVRQQRRAFHYRSRCLQDLRVDDEIRVLVCVHSAGGVHPMLTIANLSRGSAQLPVPAYLLHLVELVTSRKYAITHQLYHARDGGEDEDEWGYAREIDMVAEAVAAFTYDNAIPVRQMTAISNLASMDTDVRHSVEDARASLVILPYHMEQRYDGRMVSRGEGRRLLNQRVLQRALCTVGILVERRFAQEVMGEHLQVTALFFGGADDREAVSYAARMATQPSAEVTVCRFLLPSRKGVLGNPETAEEAMLDEEFMADMYGRFVAPGQVAYMEKHVSNGAETVNVLSSMVGTCSLFVVGKGGKAAEDDRGVMTRDMGDWDEECPELGPIGVLLASDDLAGCGSVLVLHQHNARQTKPKMRTWNMDIQQYLPQAQHHQADVVVAGSEAVVDILGSSSMASNCSLKPN